MDNNPNREYSLPHMGNMSFDKDFQQNTVENLEYTPAKTAGGLASLGRKVSEDLDLIVEEADATTTYIGRAAPGSATNVAVWQISQIDTTSGVIKKYADGVKSFTKIWDSRATYTY